MTYAVTHDCIGSIECGNACIKVCPVDCIYVTSNDKAVIEPHECIDCDACRPECPVGAIKTEDKVSAAVLKFNATESAKVPRSR